MQKYYSGSKLNPKIGRINGGYYIPRPDIRFSIIFTGLV